MTGIFCRHCGSGTRLRFIRAMTNVDKLFCRDCKKYTYARRVAVNRGRVSLKPKIPERPTYAVYNHQQKGDAFIKAIDNYSDYQFMGERVAHHTKLAFVLTDSDIMGRQTKLARHKKHGCNVFFVIPHTARPNTVNDIEGGWLHTTAQFVVTSGHADVMRLYGYDKPLHPVGWSMCPLRKFKPRAEPREVLFAPIHPRCGEIDKDVNAATFKRLFKLAKKDDIKLTVRFIKSLQESGLEPVEHPNVRYVSGWMRQEFNHIDEADVVVGHQTFGWLAVARGVPAVMMAEDMPTHIIPRGRAPAFAKNWGKYEHLLAYPLDILATRDTLGLLRRAVRSDVEIQDWYRRMIGYPFKPERVMAAINKYL